MVLTGRRDGLGRRLGGQARDQITRVHLCHIRPAAGVLIPGECSMQKYFH